MPAHRCFLNAYPELLKEKKEERRREGGKRDKIGKEMLKAKKKKEKIIKVN